MSSPSLAARADNVQSETQTYSGTTSCPEVLVVSVRADEQGTREAARWAERVEGASAEALSSTDARLDARLDTARRVLVLDPGALAAWRGFGARATASERLQLIARLAGRAGNVTWASTAAQATQWVGGVRA
ncbi:hypothetical protein [Actinomycetospora atypica]|uniref:Uncharacterized protein n=1 Tax=Actinomycetospora atypica TaxID=1290095 RepID=A0ABV9YEX7_9PSEU